MAVSVSTSPTTGSSVYYSQAFTFQATISGGTFYSAGYAEYTQAVAVKAYDSSDTKLGDTKIFYISDCTVLSNGISVSINLSEIFPSISNIAKIVCSGYLYYDSSTSNFIYFDGTSDHTGTDPYYSVINYTACGAPTACSVSATLATGNVTLSWSGATAGTANAITGYEVQRAESSDGSTWGSWAALTTVSSTSGSASVSVAPPSTYGNYYKYRVRTQGAAGSSYYSGWKESTNTLRRDHAPLSSFTDTTLTAGASIVKALYITELQTAVNTLRTFYGLTEYSFSACTAGVTSLAKWTTLINELRAAVDEVCTASGKTHETWIAFSVNCPRVDVLSQLRAVVLAI